MGDLIVSLRAEANGLRLGGEVGDGWGPFPRLPGEVEEIAGEGEEAEEVEGEEEEEFGGHYSLEKDELGHGGCGGREHKGKGCSHG